MAELKPHGMLAEQTDSERYRHEFLVDLKSYLMREVAPTVQRAWAQRVEPAARADGHEVRDRHEVATLMDGESEFLWWSALARTQHELYVDSTANCVHRQLPALIERYRAISGGATRGSLSLDPGVPIPDYQSRVDTHCIPGGYFAELADDDVYVGARYDIGLNLFSRGQRGARNDRAARHSIAMLQARLPEFTPQAVLDLGCGIGNTTLPFAETWPQAAVTGIDLSAPALRYAHARAESLGVAVHFRQANAECTALPDASFDIVAAHILLHETSRAALDHILAEAFRLLRPGGVFLVADVPRHLTAKTPFEQYTAAWDAQHNNEPFFGALLFDIDLGEIAVAAGFDRASLHEELTRGEQGTDAYGYWGLLARKPAAGE
jgi:ubiquinone/menaquinone biosynthesis C-methylase UbiE